MKFSMRLTASPRAGGPAVDVEVEAEQCDDEIIVRVYRIPRKAEDDFFEMQFEENGARLVSKVQNANGLHGLGIPDAVLPKVREWFGKEIVSFAEERSEAATSMWKRLVERGIAVALEDGSFEIR
jgi:hypothetical protein